MCLNKLSSQKEVLSSKPKDTIQNLGKKLIKRIHLRQHNVNVIVESLTASGTRQPSL